MTKIIQLGEKLQHSKEKRAEIIRKRKILAVQKIFQCMHCVFKCEKCGTQIAFEHETAVKISGDPKVPYRFCESCSEEYVDYVDRMQGKGNPEYYWHNEDWIKVWNTWIDHKGVIDGYLKSKEFKQLLDELKETSPNK